MNTRGLPIIERFLFYTKEDELTGCVEWHGWKDKDGYGRFWVTERGKSIRSHRFSYEYYIGELEDDLLVCHHCDNPCCVNPMHLFKGTHKDNVRDAMNKGRRIVSECPSMYSYANGCRCDQCKKITCEYMVTWRREWRIKNPDKVEIANKKRSEHRSNNPELYKEQYRKRRISNPDKVKQANDKRNADRALNPEKYRAIDRKRAHDPKRKQQAKDRYAKNPVAAAAVNKRWRDNNPEKMLIINEKKRLDRLANPEKYRDQDRRKYLKKQQSKLSKSPD